MNCCSSMVSYMFITYSDYFFSHTLPCLPHHYKLLCGLKTFVFGDHSVKQSHLCEHWVRTIHWLQVGQLVGLQLKAMAPLFLKFPAVRGTTSPSSIQAWLSTDPWHCSYLQNWQKSFSESSLIPQLHWFSSPVWISYFHFDLQFIKYCSSEF